MGNRWETSVVSAGDYFECKTCKRLAAFLKEDEDQTHCPQCGSDKGRVVPGEIAKRLFALGIFSPVDSSGKPTKKTKDT